MARPPPSPLRKRILFADDHELILQGLRRVLESEYDVLEPVSDGRELIRRVPELRPDLVIVDISMPLLNGLDATSQLTRTHPKLKVIILTVHADVALAARAFDAGASGYLLKQAASTQLKTAIETVLRGGTYVPPDMTDQLLKTHRRAAHLAAPHETTLTGRQREVLQLIAEGHTAAETAKILHVSPRTVEFHKYRIMATLGAGSSAELVRHAIALGLIRAGASNPTSIKNP